MELHHRLRRDPSWHPSGCNICGQLGHQAANCTTGTVNWRAMYGDDVFRTFPTVFQSDIEAAKRAKQIDFEDLERRARDFAKMRESQPAAALAAVGQPPAAAKAAADDAKKLEDERRKEAERDLPEGWAVAFDASKKPYFWHKQTKKVQWDKPTADTPIN